MKVELKKRIYTSLLLFTLVILMFLNKAILLFFLIVIYVISFIEFSKIINKIFKKKNILKLFFNFIFLIYFAIYLFIFYLSNELVGLKVFIYLCLMICVFSDIGGLFFGRYFKGPKLTKISPKKTISGSIGSFVFSLLAAMIFYFIFPNIISWYNIFILSCSVSFGCQLGDIFFSLLKRKANLKDTGNILPGHGGILDRIDGMLIGIPLGIIILLLFNSLVS